MHQNVVIVARDGARERHHKGAFFASREGLRDGALLLVGEGCPVEKNEVPVGPKAVGHEVVFHPVEQYVPDLFGVAGLVPLEPLRALLSPLQQRGNVFNPKDALELSDKGGGVHL